MGDLRSLAGPPAPRVEKERSGMAINTVLPEEAAEYLRNVDVS
jgi:hypothetical protein